MNKIIHFLSIIFFLCFDIASAQNVEETCITEEEQYLASEINDFRVRNGLEALPVSISLTYVAKAHIYDLENNKPDTGFCSTASWSENGNWSACCINPKSPDNNCMWNKPKELTKYKYRGYELSYYQDEPINTKDVIYIWKTTPAASDLLLCKGKYKNHTWKAMGIGIDEHYVCVWFGQSKDIYGEPKQCKDGNNGALAMNNIQNHNEKKKETEKQASQEVTYSPQTTDNQISSSDEQANSSDYSSTPSQKRYHVIVGSFSTLKNAQNGKNQIEKNNSCKIIVIKADNKYRLSLENYATKEEAQARKEKLSSAFPGCWVFEN